MSEPFLAEVRMVGFNFAPRGWALCDGQILPINQNTSLFSLLGTTYGGDGRTSFGLPDLRGRTPVHLGSTTSQGEKGGEESHTLSVNEMPSHRHAANTKAAAGTTPIPGATASLADYAGGYGDVAASPTNLSSAAIANSGGGQAHNNMQPYLALNFAIALQGLFPSRN